MGLIMDGLKLFMRKLLRLRPLNEEKFKTNPHPEQKLRVRVCLVPMGDRIKYTISGNIYCSGKLLPKSRTYFKDDSVWNAVFGSKLKTKQFLKRNRVIYRVI